MILRSVSVAVLSLLGSVAHAQSLPQVGVEATSDERRRGLSWSGGRASISGDVAATLGGIDLDARVAALRESDRQYGADAVADIGAAFGQSLGPVELRALAIGHVFAGAMTRADYGEVGVEARYTLGPVEASAGATWAPPQRAIGGSNLYLSARAVAGIPATPFTLVASIGRSSGTVDDPVRANRLRPGGAYSDWRLGVDHVTGPLTLGVDYVGTDLRDDAVVPVVGDRRHSGDAVLARARLSF
ncbi:TorF family putative porin [Sphingomonas silueang]|uniref:TorF family putative porin n=1 Tax=Sphingomonas silueang TaxID=3156617 RepID=UPI0032B4BC26